MLAIDANPDANLAMGLGIPVEEARRITPIAQLGELIKERTGADPGSVGSYFKLNPWVDDLPDRLSLTKDNIKLLVMGSVKTAGGGCICPESTLLRSLVDHLLLKRSEVLIMDMDAGVEHLGRGTARSVDAFIVVVEPGQRSIQTAETVRKLAQGLGIDKCYVVGSKVKSIAERRFIADSLPDFEVLGFISYNAKIAKADLQGVGVFQAAPEAVQEARRIKEKLNRGRK